MSAASATARCTWRIACGTDRLSARVNRTSPLSPPAFPSSYPTTLPSTRRPAPRPPDEHLTPWTSPAAPELQRRRRSSIARSMLPRAIAAGVRIAWARTAPAMPAGDNAKEIESPSSPGDDAGGGDAGQRPHRRRAHRDGRRGRPAPVRPPRRHSRRCRQPRTSPRSNLFLAVWCTSVEPSSNASGAGPHVLCVGTPSDARGGGRHVGCLPAGQSEAITPAAGQSGGVDAVAGPGCRRSHPGRARPRAGCGGVRTRSTGRGATRRRGRRSRRCRGRRGAEDLDPGRMAERLGHCGQASRRWSHRACPLPIEPIDDSRCVAVLVRRTIGYRRLTISRVALRGVWSP